MLRRISQPGVLALLAALLEGAFLAIRWLHPLDESVAEVIAVGLAASVIYLGAAWLALSWRESTPAALAVVLLATVVFRATLFPLPPTLSKDLYRYVWEGEIQLAGQNPYLAAPADPRLADVRPAEFDRLPGKEVPTAYAPLTELLFRVTARLDGPAGFKLASVVFDLGTLLLVVGLLRVRRQPPVRALLYGWCPLVVLEFAGSGHNDSLVLFTLLLASLLIIRRRVGVSIVVLAAATMSKWFAGVAAPVFLRRGRWWGVPLFAATALLLGFPYRAAGGNLLAGVLTYAETWRNNASLYGLLGAASGEECLATGVALGVVGGLALHCALARTEPLRACYLLIAALLLLSPSVFPWYVTWLVPFLCFFPHPALLLFTATVLLSYHVLIDYTALGLWHYTPWLVWLEYLPVYALLLWGGFRPGARRGKRGGAAEPAVG
ncbi:MAG: hypothetical protein ACE5HL_08485 [Terriglobia bacterium]